MKMPVYYYAPIPLYRELESGEDARVIAALKSVKSSNLPRKDRFEAVRRVLESTKSTEVRNQAALAIADMKYNHGAKYIINQLKNPETRQARGTLLYALDLLDEKVPMEILMKIIFNDTLEARAEALGLLSDNISRYLRPDLEFARSYVLSKRDYRRGLADEVLNIINEEHAV